MAITLTISDIKDINGAEIDGMTANWLAYPGAIGALGTQESGQDSISSGEIVMTVADASTAYTVSLDDDAGLSLGVYEETSSADV